MKEYKLLGADGKFYTSTTPGTYGGNSKAKIYGRLDCPAALATIKVHPGSYESGRVFFADEKTAIAAGYRPREVWHRLIALCLQTAEQMVLGVLVCNWDGSTFQTRIGKRFLMS